MPVATVYAQFSNFTNYTSHEDEYDVDDDFECYLALGGDAGLTVNWKSVPAATSYVEQGIWAVDMKKLELGTQDISDSAQFALIDLETMAIDLP